MTNAQLLKLLVDKKVADSYQFFESCQYKLDMAELSYNAMIKLISQYQEDEAEAVDEVLSKAKQDGYATYVMRNAVVDFFGIEISTTVAIEKLFAEITGLLHNFFDTFAQWMNTSLFGEKALPIKRVSLNSVVAKLPEFPEYTGAFINDVLNVTSDARYIYVSDFNNTQKHRYQLYVDNRFDLLTKNGQVSAPNFEKDGRVHLKADVLSVVADGLDYCKNLLADSQTFVENYYATHDCDYVEHRMYNPKTYLFFETKADYEQMKNPKNHYYYIDIDVNNILPEYHIMIVRDTLDQEDGSIDVHNSVYPIIMLRNSSDEKIVGILTPEDGGTFRFGDEHNLVYRKYQSATTDYQLAMFRAICEGEFNYYPMLSDATILCEQQSVVPDSKE